MTHEIVPYVIKQFELILVKNIFLHIFSNVQREYMNKNLDSLFFFFLFKRGKLAAAAAVFDHHRLSSISPTTAEDPDINVVDIDDETEREEKSTSGTTSLSCQESLNSDQRYSPSTQTDILYSKSPNVSELDPPKCVICMVRS